MNDHPTIAQLLQTARGNAAKVIADLEMRQQDIAPQTRYAEGTARIRQALDAATDVRAALDTCLSDP